MKFRQNRSQIRSEISGNNCHLIALSSHSFVIPLKDVITPEQSTEFLAYLHSSLFQANAHSPVETEVNALVKANVSAPKVTKETSVQSVSTPNAISLGMGQLRSPQSCTTYFLCLLHVAWASQLTFLTDIYVSLMWTKDVVGNPLV